MKRLVTLLLALLMVFTLAGCNGGSEGGNGGGDDKTHITFWTQDTVTWVEYFDAAIARFEADNPDVDVEVEYFSSFADKVNQAFDANTEPDVVFTWQAITDFANAGKLQEVPESVYSASDWENLFFEGAIANKQLNGKYYAVSDEINVESPSLYVNMTMLNDLGVALPEGWVENNGPASWAELFEFAKSLTEKDGSGNVTRAGLSYAYAQWEAMFESLIWQFGGEFRDAENKTVHFQTPEAKQALEFMLRYLGTGEDALCAGTDSRYDEFATGLAAMCVGAPWYAGSFDYDMEGTEYQVFNLPAFVEGADPICLATGGWAYVVTTNCPEEKSEAAWKFVKYLTSAYEDGEWAITTGAIPARADALTDLTYDVNKGSVEKAIAITMDVLGYAQEDGAYMLTPSTLTYSIIREALYQVLTDGDVDAALATIQSGAETMLAENYSR